MFVQSEQSSLQLWLYTEGRSHPRLIKQALLHGRYRVSSESNGARGAVLDLSLPSLLSAKYVDFGGICDHLRVVTFRSRILNSVVTAFLQLQRGSNVIS